MTFAQSATTYIASNILLGLAFILVLSATIILKMVRKPLCHQIELKLQYFIIAMVIGISIIQPFMPQKDIFKPFAKVWVAESGKSFAKSSSSSPIYGYISSSTDSSKMFEVNSIGILIVGIALLLFIISGAKLILDLRRLLRIRSQAYLVRKIHSLRIYISDEIQVPFSFWIPGYKNVVIPQSLVGKPEYRMAVLHEIHHHRQGDTKWVYLLWGLRLLYVVNPIIHLWSRWIAEIQEFACDEALVGRQKVESLAYANCLVQVAQSALNQERQPVCATGLMFLVDRKILKRRIETMLDQKKPKLGWHFALPIGAAIVAALSVTAYASQGLIQDRRVSLSQAQEMGKVAEKTSEFPIVVNERVLKWLNYFIGTPDGRKKVKAALARMENHRGVIEKKLQEYQLPNELMAIPLIESGYKNLEPIENPIRAAGLWQFIASTAHNFGLRVDEEVDERLHVELASDAAMRYLLGNKLRFNDWQLSILSYNAGENAVQEVMNKTGSRDPWVLIRSGLLPNETTEYLPKLMAAILVMKNPNSIQ